MFPFIPKLMISHAMLLSVLLRFGSPGALTVLAHFRFLMFSLLLQLPFLSIFCLYVLAVPPFCHLLLCPAGSSRQRAVSFLFLRCIFSLFTFAITFSVLSRAIFLIYFLVSFLRFEFLLPLAIPFPSSVFPFIYTFPSRFTLFTFFALRGCSEVERLFASLLFPLCFL